MGARSERAGGAARATVAVRLRSGARVPPFAELEVGALPVLNRPLAAHQEQALAENGLRIVDEVPADAPCVVFSDRCFFNGPALRRLLAAGGHGRAQLTDLDFWRTTGPLQPSPAPGVLELALLPAGADPELRTDPWAGPLPLLPLDLGLRDLGPELPAPHPSMAHALRPVKIGEALAHGLSHWSHLLRINQLGLAAMGEAARGRFEAQSPVRRALQVAGLLLRAGSADPARVAAALTVRGRGCKVHPTAVVEACQLGEGVEIGAYSVLRGCLVGEGAKVEEHATVLSSVLGPGAHVGRYGFSNLCVIDAGARISNGGGYQASVIGAGAFMAWGATALDMSFGREVMVEHEGQLVESGHHLLGVAVGPRAVVGNRVRLQHGVMVPADAVLVGPADDLLKGWGPSPVADGPHRAVGGQATPLRARGPAGG
ncbi:MAG: hypothetical protein JNM72_19875 [Deltaproteobacteria bacterium]|nr:hypothetical protein [Deltaproteobacteria bacterium]